MTGIYVRVVGEHGIENKEFDQLTDEQLDEFIARKPVEDGWQWAKSLAQWIRDNVKEGPPSLKGPHEGMHDPTTCSCAVCQAIRNTR